MISNKGNKDLEEFKYLIDSRDLTDKEKASEKEAILKAREERFRKRSDDDIKMAKLMQLKYQMEEYLDKPMCSSGPYFPKFLKAYIVTLYEKQKNFASDISVKPIILSHVLNMHREPKHDFLYRLILHTKGSYKGLCHFDEELWPRIYYQDKVCDFMVSTEKWERSESKHVKSKSIKA